MRRFIVACAMLSGSIAHAGEFDPGWSELVACRTDSSQTYTLFLPSTYTAERQWPLFCAAAIERMKANLPRAPR